MILATTMTITTGRRLGGCRLITVNTRSISNRFISADPGIAVLSITAGMGAIACSGSMAAGAGMNGVGRGLRFAGPTAVAGMHVAVGATMAGAAEVIFIATITAIGTVVPGTAVAIGTIAMIFVIAIGAPGAAVAIGTSTMMFAEGTAVRGMVGIAVIGIVAVMGISGTIFAMPTVRDGKEKTAAVRVVEKVRVVVNKVGVVDGLAMEAAIITTDADRLLALQTLTTQPKGARQ